MPFFIFFSLIVLMSHVVLCGLNLDTVTTQHFLNFHSIANELACRSEMTSANCQKQK